MANPPSPSTVGTPLYDCYWLFQPSEAQIRGVQLQLIVILLVIPPPPSNCYTMSFFAEPPLPPFRITLFMDCP